MNYRFTSITSLSKPGNVKSRFACCLLSFAAAAPLAPPASAAVLFSDTFEGRTTGSGDGNGNPAGVGMGQSDWGTNNNALGGSATAAYITAQSRTGGANQVVGLNQTDNALGRHGHLLNGSVVLGYSSLTTAAPQGFSIAFRLDRTTTNAAADQGTAGLVAIGLGSDTVVPLTLQSGFISTANTSFGLLFQQAANGNSGNSDVTIEGVISAPFRFDHGSPTIAKDVVLTIIPQVAGAYGLGNLVNFNVSVNGTLKSSGTFTGDGGNLGLVSFSGSGTVQRYIDDLVISSVPEPSPALLGLGLGGLVMIRRRRAS